MARKKSHLRTAKRALTRPRPAGGPAPRPTNIAKVVIFFMENHTTDNVASEVAGVDGDLGLPLAADVVVPDPPHDHAHWLTRNNPPPGGALRQRYRRAQLPNFYKWMAA